MTQPNKIGRLAQRFLMAFLETHSAVVGDIIAVYLTFQNEPFLPDLVFFQVTRKLNATGIRDALITFLIEDQGFQALLRA